LAQSLQERNPALFLSRVSTLTRDIDIENLYQMKTAQHIVIFFNHTVTQSFCFISVKHFYEISTGSPSAEAHTAGGV